MKMGEYHGRPNYNNLFRLSSDSSRLACPAPVCSLLDVPLPFLQVTASLLHSVTSRPPMSLGGICSTTEQSGAASTREPKATACVDISQLTDEYGRNIARIQTHQSLLYENALEIKEKCEGDEQDECANDSSKSGSPDEYR